MNLTGSWKYEEDFYYGKANGKISLTQFNDCLEGTLVFEEQSDGEPSFVAEEKFVGKVLDDKKVQLEGISIDIVKSETDIEYELDIWEGVISTPNLIVGSTFDGNEVEGVFTLSRIS
ncbi:hypothetical protein [Aureibacter tunicatorum]|uniref:Uncharacterized protein n=1 Tax=Aureibacter tunicatorum TaxID=866807 RepID=A0AAE3XN72_9BACT|nr:hypothetical protein [Aureibacter tunicatorum]MDR6238144.1 hypothetical protein [Aureibacter tunicatorum]BDD03177.1 hypothetical protein AUTU_06600 [Aureibacter tunicatorum]